jgi:hypothetical protein
MAQSVQPELTLLLHSWNLEKTAKRAPNGQRYLHQNLRETNSAIRMAKKIKSTQPDMRKKLSWSGNRVEEKKLCILLNQSG